MKAGNAGGGPRTAGVWLENARGRLRKEEGKLADVEGWCGYAVGTWGMLDEGLRML